MCKYLKIKENNLHICEHTNTLCTLCVLGNGKTYKEAQAEEQKEVKCKRRAENGT